MFEILLVDIRFYIDSIPEDEIIGSLDSCHCLGAKALSHKYQGQYFYVTANNRFFYEREFEAGEYSFPAWTSYAYHIKEDVSKELIRFDRLALASSTKAVTRRNFTNGFRLNL